MQRIDLTHPRFVQSELLEMIPGLTPKMIENWTVRIPGLQPSEKLGSGKKRTYSPVAFIVFAVMVKLVNLGIKPSEAFNIANQLGWRAIHFHNTIEPEVEDGRLKWVAHRGVLDLYHRGLIAKKDGQHVIMIGHAEQFEELRMATPLIHITVEVDMLIMGLLNTIYRKVAGCEQLPVGDIQIVDENGEVVTDPDIIAAWKRIKAFSTPGDAQ